MQSATSPQPDPIDIAVGRNIRKRRKELKISQEALAAAIGVTFQQVQKYERASNRVSASMLHRIANALHCHVATLYDGTLEAANEADFIMAARHLDLLAPGIVTRMTQLPGQALESLNTTVNCILHSADRSLAAVGGH